MVHGLGWGNMLDTLSDSADDLAKGMSTNMMSKKSSLLKQVKRMLTAQTDLTSEEMEEFEEYLRGLEEEAHNKMDSDDEFGSPDGDTSGRKAQRKAATLYDEMYKVLQCGSLEEQAFLTVYAEVLNGGFEQALNNAREEMRIVSKMPSWGQKSELFMSLTRKALNTWYHSNNGRFSARAIDYLDELDTQVYADTSKLEREVVNALKTKIARRKSAVKEAENRTSPNTDTALLDHAFELTELVKQVHDMTGRDDFNPFDELPKQGKE
jgi:hypothetical protein